MPKRIRKHGTIQELRSVMWQAVEMLRHYALDPHARGEPVDKDEMRRDIHCLTQTASVYARLLEANALEELDEIREALAEIREERSATQIRA